MVLLFLMSIGAAFVQRVSGFGFGIFIMTALPYLMPSYGEATTLSGLLASVTSAIIVFKQYKHLVWRKLIGILSVFLVVSFVAIHFVSSAGDGLLKIILGVALILSSAWFFFFAGKVRIRPTRVIQTFLGTLSGMMGGLFGMQGPPAVLYFVETTDTKEEYMVTAQMYFLVGNFMMTGYRAYYGFLTSAVGYGWLVGIAGVLIGTTIGAWAFRFLSLPKLRIIIYLYMAVSGVVCLL